jgi:glycosyltransferase involved in cell wall biosynthesis
MPGYVYGDMLAELYSNAAAFVLPSLLEGLPLTLLEAASYGLPIVASDIPPHREVIGAGGPGRRLFPTGNEGLLAEALRTTLAAPAFERRGAGQLRRQVLADYRWDAATDLTEAVYRTMVGSTRLAPARPRRAG